ncbi:RNA polymerase sigma factor [Chitinophaga nivalis]|uniref:RNA polymerase sigma-70 factor n=1 Tax=Chitinophaga nivalis TaxID=2991709 RepID=A0ABT3II25_9BACT|nr:RNA polymerase sigma-70 factor [Chitinophaga nivalis]MCW3466705.1 RNA polymerase sigma-70 factor [Chitinophaga nivalis]MCW3483604.1 RNA polymerase sigma-70 factor [Chitinophaga nivalis]
MSLPTAECILKIKDGDTAAFRELFYTYKDALFCYACKLSRSSELAEEAVQEVFMKVWINRQQLNPDLSIQSYLYTATRHCIFNILKKAALDASLRQAIFYHQPTAANTTDDEIRNAELQRVKTKVLDLLPPQRKLIFCLSRIDGLSHEEIAQKLGISKSTVKDQIVKASRFLKQELHTHHDIIIPMLVLTMGVTTTSH